MGNGGIIGAANVPTADVASGVWTLDELFLARKTDTWPSLKFAFELVKPSSAAVTGGGSETATISALGSVEFTSCDSLSLNGVFSSAYDNYMIVIRADLSTSAEGLDFRLRSAGSDNSTASSYVNQQLSGSSTTVSGARQTLSHGRLSSIDTNKNGYAIYMYGPGLAQPTALRCVSVYGGSSVAIDDRAVTHNQSTAYDGITFDANMSATGRTISGRVAVYGMRG